MKIKRSQGPGKSPSTGKAKKGDASSVLDFRHLLQAQMQEMQDISATAPVTPVQPRHQGDPELRQQGVQMAEVTIDSLDFFAQALENASLDAEELEPFIRALEEENQGLLDIRAQLSDDDPLAQLIEQVAAATYLETAKYRRGDYET